MLTSLFEPFYDLLICLVTTALLYSVFIIFDFRLLINLTNGMSTLSCVLWPEDCQEYKVWYTSISLVVSPSSHSVESVF